MSRGGDPVGLPAPGLAGADSWVMLSTAATQFPLPPPGKLLRAPLKVDDFWGFTPGFSPGALPSMAPTAACGRAGAQPPQFYGPTLTCQHDAFVRSGVRAEEPCRVGV